MVAAVAAVDRGKAVVEVEVVEVVFHIIMVTSFRFCREETAAMAAMVASEEMEAVVAPEEVEAVL